MSNITDPRPRTALAQPFAPQRTEDLSDVALVVKKRDWNRCLVSDSIYRYDSHLWPPAEFHDRRLSSEDGARYIGRSRHATSSDRNT